MCCPISFSRALSRPDGLFRNLLTSFFPTGALPLGAVGLAMMLSSVPGHVGAADGVLRTGERHLREGGSLHRQGSQIFRLQRVDVGLAAGTGHHLRLDREAVQEVVD